MADATYHYLSWVRSGFAASITQPDTFGASQPALATAPVGVAVSGVAAPVTHNAVVRGPGDVIGISASQVVRTDPIDGAVGVEPNYFTQIEFDRPDLPWLFTPAAAVGERLRPWLVLVVLDAEGPTACTVRPGSPLPVVSVTAEAAQGLPDLTAAYLWAHAQVILPDAVSLDQALGAGGDPRLTISRLMCPRHLSPNHWYVAAVVPAFNVGRLAGLGQSVAAADEGQLQPAWTPGAAVDLPVYYSWRFRTGEDSDFESLARKLVGRPLPAGVGTRALDVSRPGAGLPSLPPPADTTDSKSITWLDGALRPLDSDSLPARDAQATQDFQAQLTVLLDRPATLVLGGNADPVVAPPIYGGLHALVVKVDTGQVPPWVSELNLDPRTRVAAGVGTQVIQSRQEDYAARAWRQLGDVLAANRLLRSAQFARTSSLRVHARLATLDPPSMLGISYPAHQRVVGVIPGGQTLSRGVTLSRLPDVTVEPAFRRMTRSCTGIGRATGVSALAAVTVERFAAQAFSAPTDGPDGSVNMRPASEVIGAARSTVVLTALGDAQPSDATRLDTTLATLKTSQSVLLSGDALRALPLRTDAGSVAMTMSLGAVPAASITAVLTAAVVPVAAPPPPPTSPPTNVPPVGIPPVLRPPVGIGVRPPVGGPIGRVPVSPLSAAAALAHVPAGLAGAVTATPVSVATTAPGGTVGAGAAGTVGVAGAVGAVGTIGAGGAAGAVGTVGTVGAVGGVSTVGAVGTVGGISTVGRGVFVPPGGPSRNLGQGAIWRAGSVVIDSTTVQKIATQVSVVQRVDDTQWTALQLSAAVPAISVTADPMTDAAARLNVLRSDPAALTALAQAATGNITATQTLDRDTASLATSGAAAATLSGLAGGHFTSVLPNVVANVTGADDLAAARDMMSAVAASVDRMVSINDAPLPAAAAVFDLAATKASLLQRLDPNTTVAARLTGRLTIRVIAGVARRDELDPVMACPQFNDPMWKGVSDLDKQWLLPGLQLIPPDTATLVRTNPSFVAAHMVGLNHEMMRELLWREYPTDQRGTPFHQFWGRGGPQPNDIGPVHMFHDSLKDNLLTGQQPEAVLLLRSELLRRYPGSIIYLCQSNTDPSDGLPHLLDATPTLPSFRGDLPPDVTFVGFPIDPDKLRDTTQAWWFVIAQPPTEPRFGLDDWSPSTPAVPTKASDLAWNHMAPDGNPATPTPFAVADPAVLRGNLVDGLPWGANAAIQAHLTYQQPVRVAIRAADLLPPKAST